ncbi:MAG: M48 family metalloprotease [Pseudomonadota bacterium]
MFKKIILSLALLIIFLINGCAVNPVTGKQDLVLMSEQEEIALGNKTSQEVLKQYRVYDNQALQRYVQHIGNKLAAKSHRSDLNFQFTVLDSKEVNAFALPGGHIYITRGLMAYLKSEAELAAVLGHEIGHVTARHSVRQYSANQITNLGVALGSIFIPGMNQTTNQLAHMFGTALLRGYGREHELEADSLGAEYLARSNYNPEAMIDVIAVLKDQEVFETEIARSEGREPQVYHGVFATHPDNDTRLHEVVGKARALGNQGKINFVGEQEYLTYIDGMIFGDSPQEGILRKNNFYHEGLGFAVNFPKDWNVTNLPDRILLASADNKALMHISAEPREKKLSARNFMIQRLGLTNLSDESVLNVNGLKAHSGISVIKSSIGQRPTRFTIVYLDQHAFIFAGMTQEAKQIRNYDKFFLDTANSFRRLNEKDQQFAKPFRIAVKQTDGKTNFSTLAKTVPLDKYPEEQIRLLNGKFPNGNLTPGEWLKIIQ